MYKSAYVSIFWTYKIFVISDYSFSIHNTIPSLHPIYVSWLVTLRLALIKSYIPLYFQRNSFFHLFFRHIMPTSFVFRLQDPLGEIVRSLLCIQRVIVLRTLIQYLTLHIQTRCQHNLFRFPMILLFSMSYLILVTTVYIWLAPMKTDWY